MKKNKKSSEKGKKMPAIESNRARIQAIKEAIAAGTYRIDNGELADSFITDLLWEQWKRIRLLKP